jgi:hypothetical protein
MIKAGRIAFAYDKLTILEEGLKLSGERDSHK